MRLLTIAAASIHLLTRQPKLQIRKTELEWPGGGPGLSPRKRGALRGFCGLGGF